MRYFEGSVSTDKVGSKVLFQFEVPDEATEEQIQTIALECMWECISMDYEEIEK